MSSSNTYDAGVKDYPDTYCMPDSNPAAPDIPACLKITPQPGVPREEAAAAGAAASPTGTRTTLRPDPPPDSRPTTMVYLVNCVL